MDTLHLNQTNPTTLRLIWHVDGSLTRGMLWPCLREALYPTRPVPQTVYSVSGFKYVIFHVAATMEAIYSIIGTMSGHVLLLIKAPLLYA